MEEERSAQLGTLWKELYTRQSKVLITLTLMGMTIKGMWSKLGRIDVLSQLLNSLQSKDILV